MRTIHYLKDRKNPSNKDITQTLSNYISEEMVKNHFDKLKTEYQETDPSFAQPRDSELVDFTGYTGVVLEIPKNETVEKTQFYKAGFYFFTNLTPKECNNILGI